MPNTKKGCTGKYSNSMVPVRVVLIFVRCQKRAAKFARQKRAPKYVTLLRQKSVDLLATISTRNYVCFKVE